MKVYSFEKLEVWKEARELVRWIYEVTAQFPAEEKYGLVMQLRRASVSVVSNIAEGSARNSSKDQAHFSQITYSSLIEILNQLIIANDLNMLSETTLDAGRKKIENLTMRTAALRNYQINLSKR